MPPAEEIKEFKANFKKKAIKNFLEAEKYMLMIVDVAEFASRLQCWKFMLDYKETMTLLRRPVTVLEKACQALHQSDHFKTALACILSLGNYMNGNTPKGQAEGFSLKALPKLDMTKDRTNKINFVHYVCSLCYKAKPESLHLAEELKPIMDARNVDLKLLDGEYEGVNAKMNGNSCVQF